jgi:hypothetical protein
VRRSIASVTLALCGAAAGCATVVHGRDQTIPIVSNPPGARVVIDSAFIGVTPLVATVSRRRNHLVTVTHDSFSPAYIALERHLSPWVVGNGSLLLFPAIIDFRTGAAYAFPKDTIRAHLAVGADSSSRVVPTPRTRFTPGSRATAAYYSLALGFGVGHAMMGAGAAGKPFRHTQLASITAVIGGAAGLAGEESGVVVAYASAAVFVGSRLWEVGDILTRPEEAGIPLRSRTTSVTGPPGRHVSIAPVLTRSGPGAALRITF